MRYLAFVERHFDVRGQTGDEVLVLCPFHGDRTPSMYVNVVKGLFICHACGEKGSVRSLARKMGVGCLDTGIPASALRERLSGLSGASGAPDDQVYGEGWLHQFDFDHPYWEGRGLSAAIVRRFQLGYDPSRNCMTIPLRDHRSRLLGVIRRRLDNQKPKYLYPKGLVMSRHLFGSWAVPSTVRKVAVVEGSLDALACFDARVPAVALLGSHMSTTQARLVRQLGLTSVVVMTDRDKTGREAVHQIKEALPGMTVFVGNYRSYWTAKDPADLSPMQRRKIFHSAKSYREWSSG